jgi:MFS family permease
VFHRGEIGVGALMAARGLGALVGPFLGHRLSGEGHRRLFAAIGLALAVFGVAYMVLGLAPALWVAALTIFVAHLGGGAQWVLSTFGLQVLVPDRIRGRIFAVDFAMITLSLAISSVVAAAVADAAGPRVAALFVGALAVVWAVVWTLLTRSIRHRIAAEGFTSSPVAPERDMA